jgi:hypothetical protein
LSPEGFIPIVDETDLKESALETSGQAETTEQQNVPGMRIEESVWAENVFF